MLSKECFLCSKVLNANHLENDKKDGDKSKYQFNEKQIENCKKYLNAQVLEHCGSQTGSSLLWDTQLFCFNCFEASESLTVAHEVYLEIQQQLKDIVDAFNLEILRERLEKPSPPTLNYFEAASNDCFSDGGGPEDFSDNELQTNSSKDPFNHQNETITSSATAKRKSFLALEKNKETSNIIKKRKKSVQFVEPENDIQENATTKKESILMTTEDERNIFLVSSATKDFLTPDFKIEEEPLENVCPLNSELFNIRNLRNDICPHMTNSIVPDDNSCQDIKSDKNLALCKKELRVRLEKLKFGSDGKIIMPFIPNLNLEKQARTTKRKAAAKATEKIMKRTMKDKKEDDYCENSNDSDDNQEYKSDYEECQESNVAGERKQGRLKRKSQGWVKGNFTHPCEKCGRKFKLKRSLLLHQIKFKQCDNRITKRENFHCTICNRGFHSNKKRHMRMHSQEMPYTCEECGEKFARSNLLMTHKKKIHITEFNFPCDRCDKKFKIRKDLTDHKSKHVKEDLITNCDRGTHFQCNICEERFKKSKKKSKEWDLNVDLFLAHMFSHKNFKCYICGQTFQTKEELQDHRFENHPDGFACELCPRKCTTRQKLKIHVKSCHQFNERHVCEDCGMSFARADTLIEHRKTKHPVNPERKIKCDHEGCERTFFTRGQMGLHRDNFHKEVQCEICGLHVKRLYKHMECHNTIPFECDVCGKKFKRKSILSRHKKAIHEGQKQECSVCGKKFNQKLNLKIHMRTHTGEKPFQCSVCGKRFDRKHNLITHSRLHTGEKPYKCDKCGKQVSRKDNLNVHVRKCTGGVEQEVND